MKDNKPNTANIIIEKSSELYMVRFKLVNKGGIENINNK
jgi:hypothetical protein